MSWDEDVVTWTNNFGGNGVQADGIEAVNVADDIVFEVNVREVA